LTSAWLEVDRISVDRVSQDVSPRCEQLLSVASRLLPVTSSGMVNTQFTPEVRGIAAISVSVAVAIARILAAGVRWWDDAMAAVDPQSLGTSLWLAVRSSGKFL
jgi:hypothetical protein